VEKEKHISINHEEPETSLLIKYIQGFSSEEEIQYVTEWLKKENENERILLQTAQIYYAQRTKQRIQMRDSGVAFAQVQRQLHKKTRRLFLRRFGTIAGCIAFFTSVVLNYYNFVHMRPEDPEIQYITMQTNAGMRSHFTLPDCTEVFLNSASKLSYPVPFDKKERRVELDGEGYFKVVHDSEHPFVVNITDQPFDVEVLGTVFNIQAYASDEILRTTLIEGSVRLGMETAPGIKKYVILRPSEKAMYDVKNKNLHVEHVNTVYDTAWMSGKLMFKEMPLPEVLNRLSHFYNVRFIVNDPAINNYTFTGTFESRQLVQILDYLSISSQIKYKIMASQEDDSAAKKQTQVILLTKR
jgi:ferric-dicitrate binding protein FerR (iron transport regulator)